MHYWRGRLQRGLDDVGDFVRQHVPVHPLISKLICVPLAKAVAPMPRATRPEIASSCSRTVRRSYPKACSNMRRVRSESFLPAESDADEGDRGRGLGGAWSRGADVVGESAASERAARSASASLTSRRVEPRIWPVTPTGLPSVRSGDLTVGWIGMSPKFHEMLPVSRSFLPSLDGRVAPTGCWVWVSAGRTRGCLRLSLGDHWNEHGWTFCLWGTKRNNASR